MTRPLLSALAVRLLPGLLLVACATGPNADTQLGTSGPGVDVQLDTHRKARRPVRPQPVPSPEPTLPPTGSVTRQTRLNDARTWGYQLTNYIPARLEPVAASSFDLVVVDAGDDFGVPWPTAEVRAAAARTGQSDRLTLGYLSIGAAESYRPYWQPDWKTNPPEWLLQEDPDWPGSFNVAYWHPDWQATVLRSLDRLMDSGFDGVYMDLVDAYDRNPQNPAAQADMITWVCRIAAHARARDPEFLIVPQNASGLIHDARYVPCVNALGNEETFMYAMNTPTEPERQTQLLADYTQWKALGKPVFTIEYADREPLITELYDRARAAGLVPYVTVREVNVLTPGR
ncbi:MJ1477/TM1410 family putative glycoside hydrolase [Deinococcus sp.]|uniref:MJ1477/TM1410 family putative glycoside hydrolase n=1 Tax=Deinococcus sp. TaxID=47478 RepID=UPI0025C2CE2B|nr:MJ1477/TM1410 family putative glycoside hydrolase [Deinococcus sp.]